MLFVSNPYTPYGDQLSILYDDVSVLNISGELHYHAREALGVTARVDISSYTQEVEAEAWNLPPYQLAIGANYDVRDKLILKVEMQFMGLRKAKEEIRTTAKQVRTLAQIHRATFHGATWSNLRVLSRNTFCMGYWHLTWCQHVVNKKVV